MTDRVIMRISYLNINDSKVINFMRDVSSGPMIINKKYTYLTKWAFDTPFEELKIVDWEELFDLVKINAFINSDKRTDTLNHSKILDTLYEFMYDAWDVSKFNLVFHSSGYDSRILSHIIKKIYDEKGGRVLFVCFPEEERLMANIMHYEGWDKSQFTFYNEYLKETTEVFNFESLYEQFNGSSVYPFNRPYCCVEYLKKLEIIPKEKLCLWGGGFFNESIKEKSTYNEF